MLQRPLQHAVQAQDFQGLVQGLVAHICFAEDREFDFSRHTMRYGKMGVFGPFDALFGGSPPRQRVAEVAVVMAHLAHMAGCFEVGNLVDAKRFRSVRAELRDRFDEVDVLGDTLLAEMGEPTYRVRREAWAYGSSDPEDGWIYFAFCEPAAPTYEPGNGAWTQPQDEDRLLRITWTSEGPFEETMHLTARAKLEVWGPGWSWNHGWRGSTAPDGVRQQLEAIHSNDPSQSLRRPFGG